MMLCVCVFVLQGELLSPCRCDGSVRCTHQPCLIRWISERGSWSCELCYFKYQVLAISTKNPLQVTYTHTHAGYATMLNAAENLLDHACVCLCASGRPSP